MALPPLLAKASSLPEQMALPREDRLPKRPEIPENTWKLPRKGARGRPKMSHKANINKTMKKNPKVMS
jgi:hypothetical protein